MRQECDCQKALSIFSDRDLLFLGSVVECGLLGLLSNGEAVQRKVPRAAHLCGAWASPRLMRLTAESGAGCKAELERTEKARGYSWSLKSGHIPVLCNFSGCVHMHTGACTPIKGIKLMNGFQGASIWLPTDRKITASLPSPPRNRTRHRIRN